MNPEWGHRAGGAWLDFWFPVPSLRLLASLRIGTGLMLLYVLLVRSYDLELHMGGRLVAGGELAGTFGRLAWHFSLFDWVDGRGWLWSMHLTAIGVALALLLGVFPTVSGALALVFHLSYLHRNPAVVVGLDGLLTLALAYLTLLPCGRRMTVLWWYYQGDARAAIRRSPGPEDNPPWSGVVLRTLQIHLCVIYFQSGLAKLAGGWLGGVALWHPLVVAKGGAVSPETLAAHPALLTLIPYSLALFELFFPVLVWLPRLRYPALAAALVSHLAVGLMWEKLPFNFLMLVLVASFLRPEHLRWAGEKLADLGGAG